MPTWWARHFVPLPTLQKLTRWINTLFIIGLTLPVKEGFRNIFIHTRLVILIVMRITDKMDKLMLR